MNFQSPSAIVATVNRSPHRAAFPVWALWRIGQPGAAGRPGVPTEPKTAPSYSEGIGIEVWLPAPANWNERIRDYGGGGWVGGYHRDPGQIGSKVPAIVNANMGYAVGTKLPGNANQTPSREQDQTFTALVDWVERKNAPGNIVITSRDETISYPICVYPQKAKWNGTGSSRVAASYACQ